MRVWNFFLILLLDKGLKNFYTKFQVIILKYSVAITEKHDRQSSLLHPVGQCLISKFTLLSAKIYKKYPFKCKQISKDTITLMNRFSYSKDTNFASSPTFKVPVTCKGAVERCLLLYGKLFWLLWQSYQIKVEHIVTDCIIVFRKPSQFGWEKNCSAAHLQMLFSALSIFLFC